MGQQHYVSRWWESSAEEGVREEAGLSPHVSRSPRNPGNTLCYRFPPWKFLGILSREGTDPFSGQSSSQALAPAPEST